MNRKITGLLALAIVLLGIQFIQPARNQNGQVLAVDISRIYKVPNEIQMILKNSCYDCHSNDTRYPWYVHIQPMGWMMAKHILNGKENLNFSEFGSYSKRKQANKLRAIETSIKDGSMPLSSYTIMHTDAKLSKEDKNLIIDWASNTKDSIEVKKIK